MSEIHLGPRLIGPAHAPLVIAEIGINHEGSLRTAKEMVDAAARAGVEVVKHQTHIVDDIMARCAPSGGDERTLQVRRDESTAMSTIDSVRKAVAIFESAAGRRGTRLPASRPS